MEVDRSILAVLEKHGRISNAELAAEVGLSPSPCLRRVRRLEETGMIRGYRALINPAAVGRGLRVFVGVRLMRHARADVAAFERAVMHMFGPANWWLPGWLDRRLPHLAVNVPDVPLPAGAQSAGPHGPVPEILRGEMRVTKPAG
jgi:DNA-binding Lrp family transcriptional regulator